MTRCLIGILGASSFVGRCVLSKLAQLDYRIIAFSRKDRFSKSDSVVWQRLPYNASSHKALTQKPINYWICVAPIWALPEHFSLLELHNARRVIAISSTSCFTKRDSSDSKDQELVKRLTEAEGKLEKWAEAHNIDWIILRPTLIYGMGLDKNITQIARFVRRFHFFPLPEKAGGLRQPIHAEDVAGACVAVMQKTEINNRAYNISGGETLSYRDMVDRIFKAIGYRTLLFHLPLFIFRLAFFVISIFPRYQHWSATMLKRMNQDMIFDHTEAKKSFSFQPRKFRLTDHDLPK